jgi:hypothetical protein
MTENTTKANPEISQLKRIVGKLQQAANRPETPAWKKGLTAGLVGLALCGAGYEGYKTLHAGPTPIPATMSAVEAAAPKPDEALKTTMKIEGTWVTSGGLLLLNSMKDYRDPHNLTVVVPSGHGFDKQTRKQIIGKTFSGEVTKGSFNGKPQLNAVAGKYTIQ